MTAIDELSEEVARLRADYPGGDREAQALAWCAIWRECERLGIRADTWGDTTGTGRGRAVAFLRHLAAEAGRGKPPKEGCVGEKYTPGEDTPDPLPEGYRPLTEGEMMRVGDVYWWSGKWYRAAETMHLAPYSAERHGPMGRKVGD